MSDCDAVAFAVEEIGSIFQLKSDQRPAPFPMDGARVRAESF